MLGYYIQLASRSLRGSMMLSTLMVIAIAFGVGASMTTLTVLRVLSADPIPGKSQRLFYVQIDAQPRGDDYVPGERLPEQVTRFDAEALVRAGRADRQAMMTAGSAPVMPEHKVSLRTSSMLAIRAASCSRCSTCRFSPVQAGPRTTTPRARGLR